MSVPTDSELVARCLKGEPQAWEWLVDRYADLVYRLARRAGASDADAADTTQDVFLKLLGHLRRLRVGWERNGRNTT